MAPGGGQTPAPDTTGGEFLLSLLQKPHNLCHLPNNRAPTEPHRSLPVDPAIAAVGPTIPFDDHVPIHWRHSPPYPPNFFPHGFPQNSNPCPSPSARCSGNPSSGNQFPSDGSCHRDQLRNVNHFPGKQLGNGRGVDLIHQEPKFMFGSLSSEIQNRAGATNDNAIKHWNFDRNKRGVVSKFDGLKNSDVSERNRSSNGLNLRMQEPPGFPSKMRGGGKWNGMSRIMSSEQNAHMRDANFSELNSKGFINDKDGRLRRGLVIDNYRSRGKAANGLKFSSQIEDVRADNDCGGDDDKSKVWGQDTMSGGEQDGWQDHLTERLVKSLVLKNVLKREKHYISRDMDVRSDTRGKWLLSQRMRNFKSLVACRSDIERLNIHFLAIYESLVPEVEEKAKQKQLLTLLETLVSKEWPNARLYLYGSCANTFGVSKSDIDVCLAIEGADIDKSEILLKLADILQAENLQNVQALTRARVPIVKLMDPATGISCDICINNVLAVVNTKLLLDYAQIDVRLHQLAFIVKHWAKSRRVNETYQGTLSSYAYVLMCIHFLQQRKPAILPCLQAMEATYSTTIDTVECAYFDQVQNLRDFGSHNKESIAQLVWGFFCYWAYRHDYANAVISVRTGSIISKQSKDWTRRIGNDRHLICIEDPFEVSHDLGRVVDKYSIKVLREEFERAADIMQNDPNPCVALFEPYAHL